MVLVQLGAKTMRELADYCLAGAAAALVALLGVPVPYALIGVGAVAIWWHGRRRRRNTAGK